MEASCWAASELEYYVFKTTYRDANRQGYQSLEPLGWYLEDYNLLQGALNLLNSAGGVQGITEKFKQAGLGDVGVLVGGIIPEADVPKLLGLGVARVFGPGSSLPEIAEFLAERKAAQHA